MLHTADLVPSLAMTTTVGITSIVLSSIVLRRTTVIAWTSLIVGITINWVRLHGDGAITRDSAELSRL